MTTAAQLITDALHLFGIIDQTEDPTPSDIAAGVASLNDMLRSDHVDGAAQYLIKTISVQLPKGVQGNVYTFSIGTGKAVNVDAVAMRQMWVNDISPVVNRETRGPVPKTDVVRTTYLGMLTKWTQERQIDGSVLVTAWQPPRAAITALIEYGGRIPALTAADGSDTVGLPPEGIYDAKLLFGLRSCPSYGRSLDAVGVLAQDALRVDAKWRQWANGQQWLRMLRS
jgi:hypothetical protein